MHGAGGLKRFTIVLTTLLLGVSLGHTQPGGEAERQAGVGQSARLQVVDSEGKPIGQFPLRHTDVRASVSGSVTQVTVEQHFQNPYERAIEAVYIFPLPHEAAVNDFEIRIGERVVRGEIHERQAAREIYERAKNQGKVAALLDQERPNIFTQSVANILPGHEIVVQMRYVETLKYENGTYEFVFPTVVGPRFIPGGTVPPATEFTPASQSNDPDDPQRDDRPGPQFPTPQGVQGTGWGPDTPRVPDGSRITPRVIPPGMRTGHDIMITMELDAGVPIQELKSPSHVIDVERPGRNRATVRLKPSDTIPNKDFVLRFTTAGEQPEFALLAFRDPDHSKRGAFLLLLQPEADVTAEEARPKEVIFLLDASGSMRGEPMAKVKAAMRWALQHLNPDDTFQIIRFSESASPLAAQPLANTPENIKRALSYIERLSGQGGTHMRAGIEAALQYDSNPQRLRLVFFMTDGYIGNEEEILGVVRTRIGAARLFSFGVGSSVNRYLLDKIAEEGRGIADYVSLQADTREVVERFYSRVAKPYLTDISIDWGTLEVLQLNPARLPDLFAGQPLVVSGRYEKPGRGTVTIRGKLGRHDFRRRLAVRFPERRTEAAEIGTLWARKHIASLMREMVRGEQDDLVREVTDTALQFRLVSRYTSFVAVDNQVINADGTPTLVAQPVEMPEGVSYEGVFGEPASSSMPATPGRGALMYKTKSMPSGNPASTRLFQALTPSLSSEAAVEVREEVDRVDHVAEEETAQNLPQIAPVLAQLQITVQPERAEVRVGEPIRVKIKLHNPTSHAVQVPEQLELRNGSLQVGVTLDGNSVPAPMLRGGKKIVWVELQPGQSRSYTVTLNERGTYAFAVAGRYEIEIVSLPAVRLAGERRRCSIRVR